MKTNREKKEQRIDVHNDNAMRAAGLWRPYDVTPRDPSVWTKTKKEKEKLKRMKYIKFNGHFLDEPRKHPVVTAKLIIYLTKNKKFKNTTYSFICTDTKVPGILQRFMIDGKYRAKNLVSKYVFNGRTYAPNETIICR